MSAAFPPRVRSTCATTEEPENNVPPSPTPATQKRPQNPKKCVTGGKTAAKVAISVLRQKSMNLSCSSEASTSSTMTSGSASSRSAVTVSGWRRRQQCGVVKVEKSGVEIGEKEGGNITTRGRSGLGVEEVSGGDRKKRCGWVTPTSDPSYIAFHDEEWGVPVHDDKKLFELLSLSGALAELAWPVILNKRQMFREVFLDFDPVAVSKLNEKKIAAPGTPASSLLSELKLRSIIENGRQMCKLMNEFGSLDKYIWSFVNYKPIVGQFRCSRQVPAKTPKAEFISKDLVRRGFRSVGPTVIYSFMQVAGLSNDHLISCFRFNDCMVKSVESKEKVDLSIIKTPKEDPEGAHNG